MQQLQIPNIRERKRYSPLIHQESQDLMQNGKIFPEDKRVRDLLTGIK